MNQLEIEPIINLYTFNLIPNSTTNEFPTFHLFNVYILVCGCVWVFVYNIACMYV